LTADPQIIAKAVEKTKNLTYISTRNTVQANLPLKRNKIFILNINGDRVKELEDYISTWNDKAQIKETEYLNKENNF